MDAVFPEGVRAALGVDGVFLTPGVVFPPLPGIREFGVRETLPPPVPVFTCCLVPALTGLEVTFPDLIPEAVGILLVDLVPPVAPLVVAGRDDTGLVGVALGVVLEREDILDVVRLDLGLTGRNPLVDLLSRSETGAKGQRKHIPLDVLRGTTG